MNVHHDNIAHGAGGFNGAASRSRGIDLAGHGFAHKKGRT
jgi:hypothetical protein